MSFEESVQQWVTTDNKIRSLNEQLKSLREERNSANETIMQYVETKKLTNATVKISDGKLRFVSTRQTAPLTLKYVEECLGKCIQNMEQVGLIMNYIKESRNVKYIPDIKRHYENN
jgi:uncharacterized coiled-coil DUF342 family protein